MNRPGAYYNENEPYAAQWLRNLIAADLPAAGIAAPHKRQRLWWMAHAERLRRHAAGAGDGPGEEGSRGPSGPVDDRRGGLGDADRHGRTVGPLLDRSGRSAGDQGPSPARPGPWSEFDIVWCDEWACGRGWVPRRVEPGPQQMADGFSESLGRLRPEDIDQIQTEIDDAQISERDARQALRDLWLQYAQEAVQRTSGRCHSVREAPILLAFLRELQREGWKLIDHLPPSCLESAQAGLRELRQTPSSASRSPSEPESAGQFSGQSADAMSFLSQVIARAVERTWMIPFPLTTRRVPCRVGKLRAYGNAIVPQVAAEFVKACSTSGWTI